MLPRVVVPAVAALSGVAAWLSLGSLAVVDGATRTRVGALPPWWVLGVLVALFVGGAAARRWSIQRALPLVLTWATVLPWLPGPIPSAFLLWYGPLGWAMWVMAAIGLVRPVVGRPRAAEWLTRPSTAPLVAACAGVALFSAGAVALQPRIPAGDEPHYLIITQSLWHDGDLRIEDNHARGEYAPYFDNELRPDYIVRGQDGQIYPIHAPGVSVLLLPAFVVGGYAGAVFALLTLAALGFALTWTTAWLVTERASAAWLAWASVALTAPGYFHAFTIFPDVAGAACTAVGLWAIVRCERAQALSMRELAAVGSALAILPWLHTRFAILAATMGIVLLMRLAVRADRWRSVAAFLLVPLVSAVVWFGYFWLIWGTPNPAAPYGAATQTSFANLGPGLLGLLADQQFGLVANAPIYVLAFAGMVVLVWHRPRLALELAVVAVPYTLAVASYQMWWGGHSAPARFLVAALPLASVPIASLWSRANPGGRALAAVLLTASLGLVLARVAVDRGALLYNVRDGFDLLLDWANRSVNLPLAFPSLHRSDPWSALSDVVVWCVVGGVLGVAVAWLVRRDDHAWTAASAALALTIAGASSIVWASYPESVTPNTSALDLLHQWPSRGHAVGWRSRPFAWMPADHVPLSLELSTTTRGTREPGETPPLFSTPRIPAGEYELAIDSAGPAAGSLAIAIGRTSRSIDTLTLDGRQAGPTGLVLRLPVAAHSLTILGDETARRSVSRVTLRPRRVWERGERPDGEALRATRYGSARVFFLDDYAYMEPAGAWTRGGAAANVVIDTLGLEAEQPVPPPVLHVRAGAIPAAVTIQSGRWRQSLRLAAGEGQDVPLPSSASGIWQVRVETDSAFRPADHDAGSTDRRSLGVWIEVK